MIGNSLRSDIGPVLELGVQSVHIQYKYTLAHEGDAESFHLEICEQLAGTRFWTLKDLADVPEFLSRITSAEPNSIHSGS
jgi:putative hydrolase of the HAD superfamily